MDLEPVKRSARNKKRREENISFSRRSREIYYSERDKLRLESRLRWECVCVFFVVLNAKSGNKLLKEWVIIHFSIYIELKPGE